MSQSSSDTRPSNTGPSNTRPSNTRPHASLGRLLALPLIWPIRFYQRFISPATPPTCRYYPTCSGYAVTALERFGPVKGFYLAARRLLRCHPWAPGGVDHVPETFTWRRASGIPDAPPQADPHEHGTFPVTGTFDTTAPLPAQDTPPKAS